MREEEKSGLLDISVVLDGAVQRLGSGIHNVLSVEILLVLRDVINNQSLDHRPVGTPKWHSATRQTNPVGWRNKVTAELWWKKKNSSLSCSRNLLFSQTWLNISTKTPVHHTSNWKQIRTDQNKSAHTQQSYRRKSQGSCYKQKRAWSFAFVQHFSKVNEVSVVVCLRPLSQQGGARSPSRDTVQPGGGLGPEGGAGLERGEGDLPGGQFSLEGGVHHNNNDT